jgi:hypothetical protein
MYSRTAEVATLLHVSNPSGTQILLIIDFRSLEYKKPKAVWS